jgi:hypothetical protein
MSNRNRRGGKILFKIDGARYAAKGNFTYNLGADKKEGIVGADAVHGYKAMPQVPYIEGAITDRGDLSLRQILDLDDATVTLELANGKTVVLSNAWYAGDGNATTEEGEFEIRLEGLRCEEF